MSNLSNTWCPLPFMHVATRPNGDVRLCATSNASGGVTAVDVKDAGLVKDNGKPLNLRDNTLDEVWNCDYMKDVRLTMMQGNKPLSCMKCYNEERLCITSKRQWETQEWANRIDYDELVSKMAPDGSMPMDIPYFDLRLGNMCQLKCVMCSPHDSSAWIKDWKQQFPKYKTFELIQDQGWDSKFDYTWYQKGSFLDTMKGQAQYIKELYFAGGEPTLIPEHYKILSYMVEVGASKNCVLRYNSNGLDLPDELFELWKHFKEVKFNLSIDAYGARNEYIRYPSTWSQIEESLRRLDDTESNITVNIATAMQVLNILYIDELANWKLNAGLKKINLAPYGGGIVTMHLVTFPSYLNIRVLPMPMKELAAERINKFLSSYSNEAFSKAQYGRQRWEALIKYMMSEDMSFKLPQTIEYLEACDATRGTNFRNVFPDLKL